MNPLHNLTPISFRIHFCFTFPTMPRFFKFSLSFGRPNQNIVLIFLLCRTCYMPSPSLIVLGLADIISPGMTYESWSSSLRSFLLTFSPGAPIVSQRSLFSNTPTMDNSSYCPTRQQSALNPTLRSARPVWLHSAFPHYLINGGSIVEKKLLDAKCVFWLSLQLSLQTFIILRKTERDTIKNVY